MADQNRVEVEYDDVVQRWYVAVDGRPLDDGDGHPLHWRDYSAA
ncbi:hypothetical protein [Streptacidiphilus anmyonensis]|nr:hypothetical protein [Streptacidiphilus anmyonensis]